MEDLLSNLKILSIMDKYKFTWQCRDDNALGFCDDITTMDRIIDKWIEENGGIMNTDELANMLDFIEGEMDWQWMGRLMHGYFYGAATDNEMELLGERIRNQRMKK